MRHRRSSTGLFPEVRLSKVSASLIRDLRDDLLDPSTGTMMIVDGEIAARAIGSEVGFVQTYMQGFYYHRCRRRVVSSLALGAARRPRARVRARRLTA